MDIWKFGSLLNKLSLFNMVLKGQCPAVGTPKGSDMLGAFPVIFMLAHPLTEYIVTTKIKKIDVLMIEGQKVVWC